MFALPDGTGHPTAANTSSPVFRASPATPPEVGENYFAN
jgi:hypothetical protein